MDSLTEATPYTRRLALAALTLDLWTRPAVLWPPTARSWEHADADWRRRVLELSALLADARSQGQAARRQVSA